MPILIISKKIIQRITRDITHVIGLQGTCNQDKLNDPTSELLRWPPLTLDEGTKEELDEDKVEGEEEEEVISTCSGKNDSKVFGNVRKQGVEGREDLIESSLGDSPKGSRSSLGTCREIAKRRPEDRRKNARGYQIGGRYVLV
ncbi:hypothetical protein GW17_00057419 [Ensete ventricosum]|nr:hypothetical protein GW17_00057419 [Ensete ventricosum]